MRTNLLTLILFGFYNQILAQSDFEIIASEKITIGDHIELKSSILNETRELNIYLPQGYSEDLSKNYPVIYLLDGALNEDFIHISGIVQFGAFSWINMIPESIVVGVANVDRKRDFTFPSQIELDRQEFPTAGKSEKFISFLQMELQPFVDKTYRTTSVKTIIGQSFGGLLATEILFKNPNMFDNYIIVSPSLWWDDESLLGLQPISYNSKKSIYIAVGKEGEVMERTARELFEKLKYHKNENTNLSFDFFKDKTHGDALHIAVYNAFINIFKSTE